MKRNWATLLSIILALPLGAAHALGLGDIEVRSALNEPLDATIPLKAVQAGDLENLQVSLGTQEQFDRAGIERPFVLVNLRFEVATDARGSAILISTADPAVEPFLNFLVEVNWARGRVIREYTILLDPPLYGAAISTTVKQTVVTVPAPPPAPARQAAAPRPAAPAPSAAPAPRPPAGLPEASAPARAPMTVAAEVASRYGPVVGTDTLWSIAERFRPEADISVQRMMLAILDANPQAFALDNVNALREGAVLRIPTRDEIGRDDQAATMAEIRRQYAAWDDYRQQVLGAPATAVAGQPAAAAPTEPAADAMAGEGEEATGDSRLEVVAGGTAPDAAAQPTDGDDPAQVQALRDQLDLAMEEADAARSETDELSDRLTEAEQLIADLNRLVELKDDSIASLQGRLSEVETTVAEGVVPGAEGLPGGASLGETPADEALAGAAPAGEMPAGETRPGEMPASEMAAGETRPGEMPASEMAAGETPPAEMPAGEMAAGETPPAEMPASEMAAGETPAAMAEAPASGTASTEPPKPPRPIITPPPAPAPSTMEMVRSMLPVDPLVLAGVGVVMMLGGLFWHQKRRKRPAVADGEQPAIIEDDDSAIDDFAQADETVSPDAVTEVPSGVPLDTLVEDEPAEMLAGANEDDTLAQTAPTSLTEDDPLAEVNVYLAYERYDQAEELVRTAIERYPDRDHYRTRLLEIFFAAGNVVAFQSAARELRDAAGADSPEVASAVQQWSELAPGQDLFGDDVAVPGTTDDSDVFDVTGASGTGPVDPAGDDSGLDFNLGFDDAVAQDATEVSLPSEDSGPLDFDLGDTGGSKADSGTGDGLDFDLGSIDTGDGSSLDASEALDFDLGSSDEDDIPTEVAPSGAASGLDLDLGIVGEDTATEAPTGADLSGGLDFDLDDLGAQARAEGAEAADGLDFDLGGVESAVEDGAGSGSRSVPERIGGDAEFDLGTLDTGPSDSLDDSLALDLADTLGTASPLEAASNDDQQADAGESSGLDFNLDSLAGDPPDVSASDLGLDFDLETPIDGTSDASALAPEPPSSSSGLDLDFDLGDEEPDDAAPALAGEGSESVLDLDFDLGDTGPGGDLVEPVTLTQAPSGVGSGSLDFDIGDPGEAAPEGDGSTGLELDFMLEDTAVKADRVDVGDTGAGLDLALDDGGSGTGLDFDVAGEEDGAAADGSGLDLDLDAGDTSTGTGGSGLDFDLDAGDTSTATGALDFDLGDTGGGTGTSGLDFDLGETGSDANVVDVDLDLGDTAGGGTADLGIELDGEEDSSELEGGFQIGGTPDGSGSVDLDLDLGLDEPSASVGASDTVKIGPQQANALSGTGTGGLEIDPEMQSLFGDDGTLEDPMGTETGDDGGFPALDLDLDAGDGADDEMNRTLAINPSGEVDEVQTKLDLAQAYIDMDDIESARGALGEVLADGNSEQQEMAKGLLAKLA